MKPIYLAGPMSGIPNDNFPAFHAAARKWREAGYNIISPAELQGGDNFVVNQDDYNSCMRTDIIAIVTMCGGIALLPGYEKSRGAGLEIILGAFLGLDFYDAETFERMTVGAKYMLDHERSGLHKGLLWFDKEPMSELDKAFENVMNLLDVIAAKSMGVDVGGRVCALPASVDHPPEPVTKHDLAKLAQQAEWAPSSDAQYIKVAPVLPESCNKYGLGFKQPVESNGRKTLTLEAGQRLSLDADEPLPHQFSAPLGNDLSKGAQMLLEDLGVSTGFAGDCDEGFCIGVERGDSLITEDVEEVKIRERERIRKNNEDIEFLRKGIGQLDNINGQISPALLKEWLIIAINEFTDAIDSRILSAHFKSSQHENWNEPQHSEGSVKIGLEQNVRGVLGELRANSRLCAEQLNVCLRQLSLDLIDFEIIPTLPKSEFWATKGVGILEFTKGDFTTLVMTWRISYRTAKETQIVPVGQSIGVQV